MSTLQEIIVRRALYPLWALYEHPGLSSYLQEYEATQFWSPDRIRDLQWSRLRRLIRFAVENCAFYNRRFREAGLSPEDLRTPKDLLRIPVLTKDEIRQHDADLMPVGLPPNSFVPNFTGGSSGAPLRFNVSRRRWASRKAMTHRHDRWCGIDIGATVGQLWGHPTERSGLSRSEQLRQSLLEPSVRLNTFDGREENIEEFLEGLRRHKVTHLLAYARSLRLLVEYLVSHLKSVPDLEAAVTTAESLTTEERATIERVLGCPTFDRYGCREFSVVASQCEARDGLHIAAETLLVEFVVGDRHAEPGEPGAIVVTDLLNEATPFIRYLIGDVGTPMEGTCACGRGLPRMQMVAGRITDFIHTPDGRWISGVAVNTYLISQIPGIRQAQIVQQRCDHLLFRIVPLAEGYAEPGPFLSERVPAIFGRHMTHEIQWVDRIAPEPSGKTLVTVSQCGQLHGFRQADSQKKEDVLHAGTRS